MQIHTITEFGISIVTTVTSHPTPIRLWLNGVTRGGAATVHRHVGFEFEFDYHRWRIGTVQFYVGGRCLIIQLDRALPFPAVLHQFLDNHNYTFVGTHIASKIDLWKAQCGFSAVVQCMDLGQNVAFLRERKQGLLASIGMGPVETEWDRTPADFSRPEYLTSRQVRYACLDAFLNLYVAKLLWNIC